jgi:hypothetical protein
MFVISCKTKVIFPISGLKKLLKFHLSGKEGQKEIILFNLFRHSIFEMLTPSLYIQRPYQMQSMEACS